MTNARKSLVDSLLDKYPDTSRRRAKEWIVGGRVSVNGGIVRQPHHLVNPAKDRIELRQSEGLSLKLGTGWAIHPRVTLLHVDSSLAVVNKGAGLVSVPAQNCKISALSIVADFLAGRLKARDNRISAMSLPHDIRKLTPLPVHRLDQYTSGIFCMALNPESREELIEQLKAHTMKREYVAFAQGRAAVSKGTWRHWLQLSKDELRQQVVPEPQARPSGADVVEAITHFEAIAEYQMGEQFVTRLRLRLETGRKHQIRAQAAAAGLPLIGDRTYNPDYRPEREPPIPFSRQALHGERLELEHPETGKWMNWKAEWPTDLQRLQNLLKRETQNANDE